MPTLRLPKTLALAALPLAMAATQAQAQSYEMVIATQIPENMSNNAIYPALVHFKDLVETRTDGDLTVSIFGGGQLGSEVENGSEVQAGGRTLQSTIMSSGAIVGLGAELPLPKPRACEMARPRTAGVATKNCPFSLTTSWKSTMREAHTGCSAEKGQL